MTFCEPLPVKAPMEMPMDLSVKGNNNKKLSNDLENHNDNKDFDKPQSFHSPATSIKHGNLPESSTDNIATRVWATPLEHVRNWENVPENSRTQDYKPFQNTTAPLMLRPNYENAHPMPVDYQAAVLPLSPPNSEKPPSPQPSSYNNNNNYSCGTGPAMIASPEPNLDESDHSSGSSYSSRGSSCGRHSVKKTSLKRGSRPFKEYSKNLINLPLEIGSTMNMSYLPSTLPLDYPTFRTNYMNVIQTPSRSTNQNMRRVSAQQDNRNEDPMYREKRRKNNEAAKRSRDARKAKEDEIAIRCAFLERINTMLSVKIQELEKENESFRRCLGYPIYQSKSVQ